MPQYSLHDCSVERIFYDGEALTLHFPDGIWHIGEKCQRTTAADVRFIGTNPDNVALRYIREYKFWGKTVKLLRCSISLSKLAKRVNSGRMTLEFNQSRSPDSRFIYSVWINSQAVGILNIPCREIEYIYDGLADGRFW